MSDNEGHKGVSPPLSTDPPTELDLKLSEALMSELKAQNNFESPEATEKRSVNTTSVRRLLGY